MRTERRDAQGGDPTAALGILKQTTAGTDAPEVEGILDDLDKALNQEYEDYDEVAPCDRMEQIDCCPICGKRDCGWFQWWVNIGRPQAEYEKEKNGGNQRSFYPIVPGVPNGWPDYTTTIDPRNPRGRIR